MLVFTNVTRHFTLLESYLQAGQYLCGDGLTAADILLSYPLVALKDPAQDMGKWEKGTPQATFPKLFAYIDRLTDEAGWKKAADKIRAIEGRFYVTPQQKL